MSWLFIVNFFIFQWFGFRLAKVTDIETDKHLGWIWIKRFPLTGWQLIKNRA